MRSGSLRCKNITKYKDTEVIQCIKHKKHVLLIILLLGSSSIIKGTVVGSDSAIQAAQSFFTFPSGQSNNRLANYGWAPNGFALQNASTIAEFDSVFPVSGPIEMNAGTLTLNRDLMFNNMVNLISMGTIIGQNHILSLCQSVTALPSTTSMFQDTKIYLNNDVTLNSSITFTGLCTIEGNGHQVILASNAGIKVGGTLLMHNVILNGVSGTNVQCLNDPATLILNGSTWIQNANSSFITGGLQISNDVVFTGTTVFAYQSIKNCVINSQATLMLDAGFTFSYDATRLASKSLLQFVDFSSTLFLNGATLCATTTGLNLTKGSLVVRGYSTLNPQIKTVHGNIIDNGITFGDGLSSVNDCACTILAGSQLQVIQGSLNYQNMTSSSWFMENSLSQLTMGANTTLRLYQSMNLGAGLSVFNNNVTLARKPLAQLVGSTSSLGVLLFASL